MKTGRPTKYDESILQKTEDYIESCIDRYIEVPVYNVDGVAPGIEEGEYKGATRVKRDVRIPSAAGLAVYLGVAKSTVYKWAAEYKEFSDALSYIDVLQEQVVIDGGISGELNSHIAKLMLHNHGYSDKREVTHQGLSLSDLHSSKEGRKENEQD